MKKIIALAVLLLGVISYAQSDFKSLPPGFGTAHGLLAVVKLDARAVQKTLPKELSLAPELVFQDGSYPVAMFIGQHENLGTILNKKPVLLEKLYSEATLTFTVAGPYDRKQRYTYTSKVIVDSVPALLMGWSLGYPKRMSSIQVSNRAFAARTQQGRPMLVAEMRDITSFDPEAFKTNLEFLARNMHTTIAKSPMGYICFDFVWDFSAPNSIRPVNAKIQFFDPFAGTQLTGLYASRQLDQDPYGAVQIASPWRMEKFRRCQ